MPPYSVSSRVVLLRDGSVIDSAASTMEQALDAVRNQRQLLVDEIAQRQAEIDELDAIINSYPSS